ncbi:hypothetical protein ABT185_23900 [Streptomyces clavifer]
MPLLRFSLPRDPGTVALYVMRSSPSSTDASSGTWTSLLSRTQVRRAL